MKTICSKIDSTKFRLASGLWPKMSFEFCFNILINRVKNFGEVAAWNGVVPCDVACSFHGGCACRFSIMRLAHLKRYDRRIFKDWGVHVHLGADLEGRFIFKKWKNINQLIKILIQINTQKPTFGNAICSKNYLRTTFSRKFHILSSTTNWIFHGIGLLKHGVIIT